mgnify:CR=1 FL=1
MKTLKEYLDAPGGRRQMIETIDEVIGEFDFEKIANVMGFLEWNWYFAEDNNMGVPDKKEVEKQARSHLYYLVEHAEKAEADGEFEKKYILDGGGFYAELEIVDDDTRKSFFGEDAPDDFEHSVDILLKFVVEDNLGKFC